MRVSYLFLVIILFSAINLFSQSAGSGSWKSHLPNKSINNLALVGNKIYAGGSQTFFSYDFTNNSIGTYSKVNRFSGSSISRLEYSKETNTLVIAYDNGMLDLLVNEEIVPVSYIVRLPIIGSKKINHIYLHANKAYISTDFGLIIYNLNKRHVEDLCQIFKNTNSISKVTSSTVCKDSIFIATNTGLFATSVSEYINKLDYRNWKEIKTDGIYPELNSRFYYIASIDDKVFTSTGQDTSNDVLGLYYQGRFIQDPAMQGIVYEGFDREFKGFRVAGNKLFILRNYSVLTYENGSYGVITRNHNPSDVIIDGNGVLWIGDQEKGLLRYIDGKEELISVNGPLSSFAFRLYTFQNKMLVLTGGYEFSSYGHLLRNEGFSIYEKGLWEKYHYNFGNASFGWDLTGACYNPVSNKLFLGSYQNGMLEWNMNSGTFVTKNHFTKGVPLKSSILWRGDSLWFSGNRVPDIVVDSKGLTWITNTPEPVVPTSSIYTYDLQERWDSIVWSGNDIWQSHYNKNGPTPYSITSEATHFIQRMFIDKNDNKWFASRPLASEDATGIAGLFVYNESKSRLPRHLKYIKDKFDEICGDIVFAISQDKDGAIWLGTNLGICYFPDPEEVFMRRAVKAIVPMIDNQPLLKGVKITGIDHDAQNRKWISTEGAGLILLSADATKVLATFNESNSPLSTNILNDVKILRSTGEIFIATDNGVFSYQGSSVEGKGSNDELIAFPNPIKKDFNGIFTLDGLVDDAVVKITDISGKLVYEGRSEGSRFSWNVRDYRGHRPQTGIYLIHSSTEDGTESKLTKIAILD